MKAIRNIVAGLSIAIIALTGSAFAHQADSSYLTETTSFAPQEEQYVNDIPFNTAKIAAETQYQKAIQVQFEAPEEKEVNDIPFDTEKIAMTYLRQKALTEVFKVDEEKNVNDIPFNTEKIFFMLQTNKQLLTNK
ncbi:MAG: hypothetical protein IH595_14020 [Bacteroidales bacterium]|nr:hypothetical protein [Bacteroidales bacterium]